MHAPKVYTTLYKNLEFLSQDGFLQSQSKPKDLKYDVKTSMFELNTESYAKIKCDMDFSMYPFDSQICPFVITADQNQTYQERKTML